MAAIHRDCAPPFSFWCFYRRTTRKQISAIVFNWLPISCNFEILLYISAESVEASEADADSVLTIPRLERLTSIVKLV
jgi:hypothetical protein